MTWRTFFLWGTIFGLLGVALGAFGAHALAEILEKNGRTNTFETAVRYQFYHAFALLATGLLYRKIPSREVRLAGILFVLGTLIFSGTLYVLCLTGISWLGAITPLGGLSLIGGWLALVVGVYKRKR